MNPTIIYIALILIIIFSGIYLFFYPRWKRSRISQRRFPDDWQTLLTESLPIYKNLSNAQQKHLHELILVFLEEKDFIGCAGQEINDEVRLTIAAQACLLLLNRPTHEYAELRSIYVYPTTFRAVQEVRNEIGLVSMQERDLLGESWSNGKVVLAWDSVARGIRNFNDGQNVVLHEFAHQLDHESGVTNGAPLLYTKAAYKTWAYVLGKEFTKLQNKRPSSNSIIDHYGATNPAEFFAVATETFFEEPFKLYEHHQALFEELQNYYRLDPREWKR